MRIKDLRAVSEINTKTVITDATSNKTIFKGFIFDVPDEFYNYDVASLAIENKKLSILVISGRIF